MSRNQFIRTLKWSDILNSATHQSLRLRINSQQYLQRIKRLKTHHWIIRWNIHLTNLLNFQLKGSGFRIAKTLTWKKVIRKMYRSERTKYIRQNDKTIIFQETSMILFYLRKKIALTANQSTILCQLLKTLRVFLNSLRRIMQQLQLIGLRIGKKSQEEHRVGEQQWSKHQHWWMG